MNLAKSHLVCVYHGQICALLSRSMSVSASGFGGPQRRHQKCMRNVVLWFVILSLVCVSGIVLVLGGSWWYLDVLGLVF